MQISYMYSTNTAKTIQILKNPKLNLQQQQLFTLHHQTDSRAWTHCRCSLASEWQSCRQSKSCTVFVSSLLLYWLAGSADSQTNNCPLGFPGLVLDRYIRRQSLQTNTNTGLLLNINLQLVMIDMGL